MSRSYKMYLGGHWVNRPEKIKVYSPWDDTLVGTVPSASKQDYTEAIKVAHKAFATTRDLPSHKRAATCKAIATGLEKNIDKFASIMTLELGKAYKDCKTEVKRAIGVFNVAAEEAKRIGGEIVDLDWTYGAEERQGLVRRFPKGVIAGITPFNFPLNLVAHKIAPAIASGNTIVIKPASATPIMALMLAELIDKTPHPKGAVSILPGASKNCTPLFENANVKMITFTGSADVGWWIKQHANKKEVVLELGGNAGVAIADDADLEYAVNRVIPGSFGSAGQSCISVQRIYVHEKVYSRFVRMFKAGIGNLKLGNPLNPKTDIGVMVDKEAVENSLTMIEQALAGGAKILVGGRSRRGRTLEPTVLTDVKVSMDVCSKEAFAPLAVLFKYRNFKQV
ncbi:MAG: aldehyde dehydrogenase family protein, partial [candidate division Zixibacteria bacterium]|nr:aldehyde dehydrogenase family protein [candidate division Zixibacteria bacterium]